MENTGKSSKLFILADARYECLRMTADFIKEKKWQDKETTYLRARHSTIGADLTSILEQVTDNDDVLNTTPKVNDDQQEAVISALEVLHQKKVNYYWHHAPDWFFQAPASVTNCVSQAKKHKKPDDDRNTETIENHHYQNERPAASDKKPQTDGTASKNDTQTSDYKQRQFTDYRLMYYFMGADTFKATCKEIITVLTTKTIPKEYDELLKRFSIAKPSLAGRSDKYETFKRRILEYARLNKDVLIVGETGTGKEATAYFLHEFSSRRNRKFIAVNCACFTEDMLTAELFGHIKGSFTGANSNRGGRVEEADGGTIFLDEIPDASPRFQAMLLRFMQSGEYSPVGSNTVERVDVKIVAGAQPGLLHKLRDDIKHRFNERLHTYSIRELNELYRAEEIKGLPDIVSMARNIAAATIGREKIGDDLMGYNYKPTYVTHEDVVGFWDEIKKQEVVNLLTSFEWPGNVRQLQTLIARYLCNNLKDSNGNKLALHTVLQEYIAEEQREIMAPSVNTTSADTQPPARTPQSTEGTTIIGNMTISPITGLNDIPPIEAVKNAVYQSVKDALNGTLARHKPKEIYEKLKITINTGKKYL
ncbi:MAG: sigma 54-interacting transcriptional regulator [Geobacteraceae bacterium]|nr:sigma 54-interacting transcriptional regulator [Geobacteraceae bacterium]